MGTHVSSFFFVLAYSAVLWVVVLVLYSVWIEPFDFGPLSSFAWRSSVLLTIVTTNTLLLKTTGDLINLLVWWLGMLILFRRDFWESRVLVMMVWGAHCVAGLGLGFAISNR
ncbi:MAG: hypothetical protein NZO58_08260 [Gemmataceae bacterium]|nr:hypothetical protein [Gemmataceae bacterium]